MFEDTIDNNHTKINVENKTDDNSENLNIFSSDEEDDLMHLPPIDSMQLHYDHDAVFQEFWGDHTSTGTATGTASETLLKAPAAPTDDEKQVTSESNTVAIDTVIKVKLAESAEKDTQVSWLDLVPCTINTFEQFVEEERGRLALTESVGSDNDKNVVDKERFKMDKEYREQVKAYRKTTRKQRNKNSARLHRKRQKIYLNNLRNTVWKVLQEKEEEIKSLKAKIAESEEFTSLKRQKL
jgi:hypothetical protein